MAHPPKRSFHPFYRGMDHELDDEGRVAKLKPLIFAKWRNSVDLQQNFLCEKSWRKKDAPKFNLQDRWRLNSQIMNFMKVEISSNFFGSWRFLLVPMSPPEVVPVFSIGTTWNQRARQATPERMSPRQAWRAIMRVMPKNVSWQHIFDRCHIC